MASDLPVTLTLNQTLCWIAFREVRWVKDASPEAVASALARRDPNGCRDVTERSGSGPGRVVWVGEAAAARCAAARGSLQEALLGGTLVAYGHEKRGHTTEASASAIPREQ